MGVDETDRAQKERKAREARDERLAAELRANLKRRKAQARARRVDPADDSPATPGQHGTSDRDG